MVKRGSDLFHLRGDHPGSTSQTTGGAGPATASRAFCTCGAERAATGGPMTHRSFTGRKSVASGLMYYTTRYCDPSLGTLFSPDPMVPNSASVIGHSRFL